MPRRRRSMMPRRRRSVRPRRRPSMKLRRRRSMMQRRRRSMRLRRRPSTRRRRRPSRRPRRRPSTMPRKRPSTTAKSLQRRPKLESVLEQSPQRRQPQRSPGISACGADQRALDGGLTILLSTLIPSLRTNPHFLAPPRRLCTWKRLTPLLPRPTTVRRMHPNEVDACGMR